MCVYVCVCMYVYVCISKYICKKTMCMYMDMHTYACIIMSCDGLSSALLLVGDIYVYMYIYVYICIYTYIYTYVHT